MEYKRSKKALPLVTQKPAIVINLPERATVMRRTNTRDALDEHS